MSYIVTLDPSTAIANRTELNLNEGAIRVEHSGVDWGDAQIKPYVAEGRYGESVISYRVPNRTISIPLGLGMGKWTIAQAELARRELQQKVALIQRQGGILMRQRPGQERLYADIMTASLMIPDVYGETGGVEDKLILKLECLPDFYGDEIECDAVEGTGQLVGIVNDGGKPFVVPGDYPARTRIVLTEKGSANQQGLLWGFRSTYYTSAAESALFFDAKDLTPVNGSVVEVQAGTYSGKWLILKTPEKETWHPFMTTDLVTGAKPLTHLGSYRVWARIASAGALVRLAWSNDDATAPFYNPAQLVEFPSSYAMVDLGEIRVEEPPTGEHWWRGVLQCFSSVNAVAVDRIWLQPIDDGAGKLRAITTPAATLLALEREPAAAANQAGLHAGTAWTIPVGWPPAVIGKPGATVKPPAATTSAALALTSFGFSLTPSTIIGIVASVKTAGSQQGLTAQLIKAGVLVGSPITNNGAGSPKEFGGSKELWGATLTSEDVNSAAFGIALWRPALAGGPWETEVFQVTLRIFFGTSPPEDAVLYSTRKTEMRFDGAFREDTTTAAYVPVSDLHGDLARIPPSGLEKRPVELLIKQSRGDLTVAKPDGPVTDKIQAQLFVRPCYLGRI